MSNKCLKCGKEEAIFGYKCYDAKMKEFQDTLDNYMKFISKLESYLDSMQLREEVMEAKDDIKELHNLSSRVSVQAKDIKQS